MKKTNSVLSIQLRTKFSKGIISPLDNNASQKGMKEESSNKQAYDILDPSLSPTIRAILYQLSKATYSQSTKEQEKEPMN